MYSDYILIDGELKYWPMCPIRGCPNRICLSLNSKYCYPHTTDEKSLDSLIDSFKEKETA